MSKDTRIRSIAFEDCLDKLVLEKKEETGLSVTAYVKACVMADLFPDLRVDPSAKLSVDEIKMLNTYATEAFSEEYKEFIHFRMAKAKGLHRPLEQPEQEPILEQSTADVSNEELEESSAGSTEEGLNVPKWVNNANTNTNDNTNTSDKANTKAVNNNNTKADDKTNDKNNVNTKTKTNENTKRKPKKPFKMDDMSFEGTCI